MKQLNIIAACSENRVIGRAGKLPWKITEDWNYFLNQTKGGTLIFGRKAFEEFGHPFPDRQTIVLTRNREWTSKDIIVATSLQEGLDTAQKLEGEIWISGGQHVYEQAMPMADKLYLTLIHAEVEGDAFFPAWDSFFPKTISQCASRNDNFRYTFFVFEK